MRIVVVGAGIIGLTSAWYLVKAGHEVSIIDSHAAPAEGASFANGGLLSVGQSAPTAVPGLPKAALKQIFKKNSPMKIKPDFTWHQIKWMLLMLKECSEKRYAINLQRMINIANLTRTCFHQLQAEANIACELRQGGILQLCENDLQWQAAEAQAKKLQDLNIKTELINLEELLKVEPNLKNTKKTLVGGLRFVNEECGDCLKFAQGLADKLAELGVRFHYGVTVKQLITSQGKVAKLVTDGDSFEADAYVMATGAETYQLLKDIVYVPVYPVKGYSLTLPITYSDKAPQYAMMDMSEAVAITRLDSRIRVAGYGEVVGFDNTIDNNHVEHLKAIYDGWFPDSVNINQPNAWVGFRPMTPDGTPIVSKTPMANLYVNTGHGIYGWTMSCGSGQILANLIDNKVTDAEVADYSLNRYL